MVDPYNVTIFNRTKEELQEFLLFCIVVAGKKAIIQAKKLQEFLIQDNLHLSPFDVIKQYSKKGILNEKIKNVKLGQYNRLLKSFSEVIKINPSTCTIQDLENIPGIGPKTARFFLLHSRPKQQIAVLDTHVLKWLASEFDVEVPKSTPNGKKYLLLEKLYLNYCKDNQKDPATFDLEIWTKYSLKKEMV